MSDRELLELAAKAAGYKKYFANHLGRYSFVTYEEKHYSMEKNSHVVCEKTLDWNPLIDDGDALRLAVTLRISIEHPDPADMGGGYLTARICKTRYKRLYLKRYWFNVDICKGDAYAATRRAIVHAAAEIGRQMQEGGAA